MKSLDLEAVRWGLVLAFLSLFMGVYLGIHFGKSEDEILSYLKEKASVASVYGGDAEKIKGAVEGGWKYLKRSHEHFQGLGAIGVAVILFLSASWLKPVFKTVLSLGIGLGSFVYPLFWYLTAYRVADMGKHEAKESLALMAQFGAGIYFLSLLAVFCAVLCYAVWKDNLPSFLGSLKE